MARLNDEIKRNEAVKLLGRRVFALLQDQGSDEGCPEKAKLDVPMPKTVDQKSGGGGGGQTIKVRISGWGSGGGTAL